MIEIERKALLIKECFNNIKLELGSCKTFVQTNHYFDTKHDDFKNNDLALRIRVKDDSCKYTIKHKQYDGKNHYYIEVSDYLSREEVEETLNSGVIKSRKIVDYLEKLNISFDSVINIVSMTTYRNVYKFDEYTLFLDHTVMPNHEDYELEIEASSHQLCDKYFKYYANKYSLIENTKTKLARALT